jgi:hypothetical protein
MTDTHTPTDPQSPDARGKLARRTVLAAGSAAVTAVGVGSAFAATDGTAAAATGPGTGALASASASEGACYTLTSELVEGPYYIDADKLRQDVTEDQEGIPCTSPSR